MNFLSNLFYLKPTEKETLQVGDRTNLGIITGESFNFWIIGPTDELIGPAYQFVAHNSKVARFRFMGQWIIFQ